MEKIMRHRRTRTYVYPGAFCSFRTCLVTDRYTCWEYTYSIIQRWGSVRRKPQRVQIPLRYRQRATHVCTSVARFGLFIAQFILVLMPIYIIYLASLVCTLMWRPVGRQNTNHVCLFVAWFCPRAREGQVQTFWFCF